MGLLGKKEYGGSSPFGSIMANSYYEAHITMLAEKPDHRYLKDLVERYGWKFSKIDGDPNLGDGVKCYATKHFKSSLPKEKVLEELTAVARHLDGIYGDVIREKIELVIHDTRSSTVRFQCDGLCPECK